MNILITGDKGYIGSRLKKALNKVFKDGGHTVYGLDHRDGLDLLSAPLPEVDLVYHLAAQAGAIPSMQDPIWDARNNILGTIRIAQHYKNTKIIYVTSGGALDPESPYGLSKKTGEEYLRMLHNNTVICRLSSVYGEKDRGVVDNFIRFEKCVVFGDGSAVRDFVHVDDVVRGLVMAAKWDKDEYHMGSGIGTTVREIAEATGKPIEYREARSGEKQEAVLQNTTPHAKLYGYPIYLSEDVEQLMKSGFCAGVVEPFHEWEPRVDVIKYVKKMCL
jgi:UDP-glucose 4-epimerase